MNYFSAEKFNILPDINSHGKNRRKQNELGKYNKIIYWKIRKLKQNK